ncbi:MAG TPA: LLM class flavin-dependent oxidoreductase [Solirubrobacteraceae bacterium]|jgi:alkanesulfonate monooxygenase SsuD/methylene tetrahydromethanopterin reductase-like flavin-dependent oxidoreductase (luciferase family)
MALPDAAQRPRLGVGFTPFETRPDLILRLATQADDLGLDRVDVAEGWTLDATILLAEIALRTSRIGIGTAVISAWGRTPATIALAATGLQLCSEGRFSLGIGASSPPLTEGFHGVAWEPPVPRLRDTLTAVRALLAGDRLPDPAPGARALRLGVVPDVPVPIVLAALSAGSIRLAGELADAWTPFLWARSRVQDGRALLQEGEARGETSVSTAVRAGVPVALGPDERSARRLAAWWLSTYATRMGPVYPRMLGERFGMAGAVDAVIAAADGDELPAAAEELARDVTLMGTYDEAPELIAAWFAAGADSVGLVLPPGRPEEELAEIVQAAAATAQTLGAAGRERSSRRATTAPPAAAAT